MTHGITLKTIIFSEKVNIPSDLNDIQPRATQVWNCDKIGFDTNGRCDKVVCNYKFSR